MGPLQWIVLFVIAASVGIAEADGNIAVGAGYSADTQQMVSQKCYNATISSTSAQKGCVHLDTALTFSELENVLGISVGVGGSYRAFSAEAVASYTRSVQDKDYSMSLNYYQYATNNVAVQLAGYGDEALSDSGRGFYMGGKNPYFGLICGDNYITSYEQGALLTMGLSMQFSSSTAKEEFVARAGLSFFSIELASAKVQDIATEYHMKGSVVIQAFQMGGDPSQLARILSNDSTGQYYALTCSMNDMAKCTKAAGGLLDYAKNKFPTQFSFENNTGLTPLGTAFTQYNPLKYIGLTAPPSLVTAEVEQHRDDLFSKLKENQCYQQKLHPFFNAAYPVELDVAFKNNASAILSKANRNVEILMRQHKGAADCFTYPDNCKNIKSSIDSQLQNITADDLKFLENIKYALTTVGGMFYNTGGISNNWIGAPSSNGKQTLVAVNDVSITDEAYVYFVDARNPQSNVQQFAFNGMKNSTSMTYVGNLLIRLKGHDQWEMNVTNYKESMVMSPFYFDTLNITQCHDQQRIRPQVN